ncbi:MAG: hypothetical protein J6A05_07370 [Oscillospiraceae bacterium]|nr:hypothetical protein [Oscillospiraceae bacterium]
MIRKITAIALSALLLTACHAEEKEQQVTGTSETTATTPLTLTEIITTETSFVPEEPEEKQRIEIAVFDPFEDSVVVEESTVKEIEEALKKISDSRELFSANAFLYHLSTTDNYINEENILEENEREEYCYKEVLFADNEEELFDYFRAVFTENYMPDEIIRAELFDERLQSVGGLPMANYKTIDGILCMKYKSLASSYVIAYDDYVITYCDKNRAEVIVDAEGASSDTSKFFLSLEWSEEYGWRLDNLEYEPCYLEEATLLYNAVTLKRDTINTILSGGVQPENSEVITIDGIKYTETDTGMSLTEMQEFFDESFFRNVIECDYVNNRIKTDKPLAEKYIVRYIDEVYVEIDGVLYRRNDAPKWYLPELKIEPKQYYDIQTFVYNGGEIVTEVTVYTISQWNKETNKRDYYEIKIASELPIKPLE